MIINWWCCRVLRIEVLAINADINNKQMYKNKRVSFSELCSIETSDMEGSLVQDLHKCEKILETVVFPEREPKIRVFIVGQ